MIRILVVDDSAFMRKVLSDLFKGENDFEVVDVARNGAEAVDKVLQYSPDVVTMDVEMPILDGLSALEKIMALKPTPVIMVSSLTKNGNIGHQDKKQHHKNVVLDFAPAMFGKSIHGRFFIWKPVVSLIWGKTKPIVFH